jgi:hypothetical protein
MESLPAHQEKGLAAYAGAALGDPLGSLILLAIVRPASSTRYLLKWL